MTGNQYNNIVKWTLAHADPETTKDNLAAVRAVMQNCGAAFPNGGISEVMETLMSDEYMGWQNCTYKQTQAYANSGIASIGIDGRRIIIILPEEGTIRRCTTDVHGTAAEYIRQVSEISIAERIPMQFFSYYNVL